MRIYFSCLVILLVVFTASFSQAQTISVRVSDFRDDAEEEVTGANIGNIFRSSSDLEYGNQNGIEQLVGLRFVDLNIPQGATINSVSIQLTATSTDVGTLIVPVFGQLSSDTVSFADEAPISTRPLTTASVDWNVDPWFPGDSGANTTTPDLSTIVQEIVDQNDWSSGNSMAFIFFNDPMDSSERIAVSFDGNPAEAALLTIDFTPPIQTALLGDVNLDGVVTFLDIAPFIALLSMAEFQAEADVDEDGFVTFLDISPFIAILSGQ